METQLSLFSSPDRPSIRKYASAGRAVFTIVSKASGKHLTFKITKKKGAPDAPLFVKARSGGKADSRDGHFTRIGFIWSDKNGTRFVPDRKSPILPTQDEVMGFAWFWRHVDNLPETCQFLPSTLCCKCGMELTDPVSIARGCGPECFKTLE